MGNNQYTGIHKGLVKSLSKKYKLKVLIETGTFAGESALWAEGEGFIVHTVEVSKDRWENLDNTFSGKENIHLYRGNSTVMLEEILGELKKPALIFLDAHSLDLNHEPPVLKEIEVIGKCKTKHIVMIDDARLFGMGNWPIIQTVIDALKSTGRTCYVFEDVIVGEYA